MELVFIEHSKLTDIDLEKIICIKKIHWNYSETEHKDWIGKNIEDSDIHVLMIDDKTLVAYLNLIRTNVILNGFKYDFLGVGNVCSLKKGHGFGEKLMLKTQDYLVQNKLKGILFCKDKLISFYNKYCWQLISKDKIISEQFKNTNIMLYNINFFVDKLNYKGRNF